MKVTIKRELLTYLHHEQKLSLARMGKLLGLKEEAVFKFMKINKINIFFHDEVLMEAPKKVTQKEDGIVVKRIIPAPQCAKRLTAEIKMKLKNEAWLKEEIKKTSKSEVARKLGVASTTINHYLKKFDQKIPEKRLGFSKSSLNSETNPSDSAKPKVILRRQGQIISNIEGNS